MRGRKQKYRLGEVAEALRVHHGQVCLAARALGCSYRTLLRYIEQYPELEDVRTAARRAVVEEVEGVLVERALAGESWAIQFLLRSWARGTYGEKVEVHQQSVRVNYNLSDDDLRQLYGMVMRMAGVEVPPNFRLPE